MKNTNNTITRFLLILLTASALSVFGGYNNRNTVPCTINQEQIIGNSASKHSNTLYLKHYMQNEQVEGEYVLIKTGLTGTLEILDIQPTSPNQFNFPLLYLFSDCSYPYINAESNELVMKYELVRTTENTEPELMAEWTLQDLP